MEIQVGKQSLAFAEAPYIISSASIVGKKEGEGPLGNRFDVVGEDDKFGQNTWEEAESALQKRAAQLAMQKTAELPGPGVPPVRTGMSAAPAHCVADDAGAGEVCAAGCVCDVMNRRISRNI